MVLALFTLVAVLPCLASAQVPEGWFPFVISEPLPGSAVDASSYNNAVAGAEGFVTVRDGRFVDGSGRRIRFLATNLTFDLAFPPKDQAPRIAARMAALGINCVRFHHMDNAYNPRGIWDKAYKDRQHIDSEMLDRLDWIIYQLKLKGIYSNINLHVSRKFTEADGFENPAGLPNYDKGVDNWQDRMIELQKQFARDLLTHENPYTKTRYTDEPCIVMVELNNENSALQFAYGNTFHTLPEPYRGQLLGKWQAFLKDRYISTDGLRAAWDAGSEPVGEEMLRNRDFAAGTQGWVLESRHPEQDVFETVSDPALGKVLHARLNELGVNAWDFQIHQTGHTLENARPYTVSFKMKADPARTVSLGTRYDIADWRMVGLSESIQVTPQWQAFSFTFLAREPKPEHTRLSFNCQNFLGSVWLADVSLKPGGILGLPADQSLEAGNVAFATQSATARAWQDWVEFMMGLERGYVSGLYELLKQDLGLRALVVDTQASYGGLGGVWREAGLDYIDIHAYWQHPRFPRKSWDPNDWSIPNTPMTAALGTDTLTRLAMHRVAGKPFTVSEYNHPAPNDFRAECMPMLAAIGALQDWDGLFQFCYGRTPEDWSTARIGGYFDMAADPATLAFFPVAANLFRRGDVSPAREQVRLQVGRDAVLPLTAKHMNSVPAIWQEQGVAPEAAVRHRLALEFVDGAGVAADAVALPAQAGITSDTGEVSWQSPEGGQDVFSVRTPKTFVAAGKIAGTDIALDGGIELSLGGTPNGRLVAALTSIDNLPLAQSRRMLLVLMSKVENQGMGWSADRTTVGRNWGKGPTIAEGISATLRLPGRGELVAYPLDGAGVRGQKLAQAQGRFALEPAHKTVWYEIVAE